MKSEVIFALGPERVIRSLAVYLDGQPEWVWGRDGQETVMTPEPPSEAVLTALCLNAFALRADLTVANQRLAAAYQSLREITLERNEWARRFHKIDDLPHP